MTHPWLLVGLHLVCSAFSGWAAWLERRRYREAMRHHMVKVLRGAYRGMPDVERSWRPKRAYLWPIFLCAIAPTDVMLIWGAIEGALRHR